MTTTTMTTTQAASSKAAPDNGQSKEDRARSPFFFWALFSILAVWFLFIYAPPHLLERKIMERPLFQLHMLGAYLIYIACIVNTFLVPLSAGRVANITFLQNGSVSNMFATLRSHSRSIHAKVGTVGNIAGVVALVGGLLLNIFLFNEIETGFIIGISIGGLFQLKFQYRGYLAILKYKKLKQEIASLPKDDDERRANLMQERDEALRIHIRAMIDLFGSACSIPAAMRLADKVGLPAANILVTVICIVLTEKYKKAVIGSAGQVKRD